MGSLIYIYLSRLKVQLFWGEQEGTGTRCWVVCVMGKVGVGKAFEFGVGGVECRQSIFLHLSC